MGGVTKTLSKVFNMATLGVLESPEMPKIEAPKTMPLADDEEVKRQRRLAIQKQVQRSGRGSTDLSDGYNGNKLG